MGQARHRRRNRTSVIALLVALAMLATLGLGAVTLAWNFQSRLDANIERIPNLDLSAGGSAGAVSAGAGIDGAAGQSFAMTDESRRAPVTILVLGTDSRISAGDPSQWERGAQRTDAIMLVQFSAARDALTVMSIPRDSWVPIPGYGSHKINAAFSLGGPLLTIQTVEQLTGAHIDHFAITDFESFAALTDELGGVDIALTQPLTVGDVTLEPGSHRLDGAQALSYARERYNVEGGDFGRVQRHQNWMRSILRRGVETNVVTDVRSLANALEVVSRSVAVDEGFTIGEMRSLVLDMNDLRPGDLRFITAPYRGTGWSPDGRQSIVELDDDAAGRVFAGFADGTIDDLLAKDENIAPRLRHEVD